MDIAALSTALSMEKTATAVNMSMLKKGMDMMEQNGEQMRKMMELSVNPNVGGNIDLQV